MKIEEKRPVYYSRVFLAFLIATFIFVNGFLISMSVNYSKSRSVSMDQEEIYYDLLNTQLENYFASSSCTTFNPYVYSEELGAMGSLLSVLEDRFGKADERVITQKKIYALIELQHAFLIENHNTQCNDDFPVLLFFYSNLPEFKEQGEEMGFILGTYKNEHPRTMIYSFDYDLDLKVLQLLKQEYNLTNPNVIVLSDKSKLENLQNIDQLEVLN